MDLPTDQMQILIALQRVPIYYLLGMYELINGYQVMNGSFRKQCVVIELQGSFNIVHLMCISVAKPYWAV